jgi:hypothetical protein
MKRLMLAAGLLIAATAAGYADDPSYFWVVGNHATNKCDIVSANPVIDGDIWFEDGPYNTLDDAKLARSTIRACPKDDSSDK